MKTRITHLPNGKFIAEIETRNLASPTATNLASGPKWWAIWRAKDQFGLTQRGEEEFIHAQHEDEKICRLTAEMYVDLYYGDALEIEEKQTREAAER